MNIRFETLRNRSSEHLDVCLLDISMMTTSLVGEDVRPSPVDGSRCATKTSAKGCSRRLQHFPYHMDGVVTHPCCFCTNFGMPWVQELDMQTQRSESSSTLQSYFQTD
jgi:hypothetical protein